MPSAIFGRFVPRWCRRHIAGGWVGLVLLTMLGRPAMVHAEDPDEAVKVFNSLKPSVVSIFNNEGSGTGVLLDNTGQILTCAHVVTSPVPYQVKVDLGTPDSPNVVIFKKVQILGYHPERDLALIKIDPKENNATLLAAAVSRDKASTGQRIYAIGDPGAGDKVLEKTITQGIISGVDREFDQQKFYQIDAAVNPGNSGGPVVDHSGKVLGIVTFQFNGLQAMNFAIPLRDIDFTKFVPLTDHKANPSRSAQLLKQAREFSQVAQEAYRDQGADSHQYKLYTYYAAYCYSEALIYDPSNPEIYTDIGNEYIRLDMDESASAYLVRAIELRPWGTNNAVTYHALGLAWNKQKLDEKAACAWAEGLAKFPYASVLWDDLAMSHLDKDEYEEAAYSASVALACGDRESRIKALQRIVRNARGHLDDSDRADLSRRVDHDAISQSLDKMRIKSNKARKQRNLYMTTAFVDLMKEVGTLDVPGVEDKISQVPLKAPENLAIGEDVADANADPEATPKAKKQTAPDDGGDDGADIPPPHKRIAVVPPDGGDDVPPAPHKKPAVTPPDDNGDDGGDTAPPKKKHLAPPADDDDGADVPTPHRKNVKPEDAENGESSDESPKNKAKATNPGGGGDDWLGGSKKGDAKAAADKGGDARPASPSMLVAPTPAITGLDLAGTAATVDDAKVVPLDVDNQEIADAVFSADGSNIFVLQKVGLLRKIAVPSLKEERQTNLNSTVLGLGMTRKGLAMYVSSAQEVWLLDPRTLEVKHRVSAPGVQHMATAPGLGVVLVTTGPGKIFLVDPVAETTAKLTISGDMPEGVNFDLLAISPDGKNAFANQAGAICQFSLSDGVMTYAATGPGLGTDPQKIIISPDSRYVAMPCTSGNTNIAKEPRKDFVTYVFKVGDLQKPVMTLESGMSPKELAFDVPARQIYAQNNTRQLIVFSPAGEKIKDYVLTKDKNPGALKFVVHPSGRSLMVLAGGSLQWVTLP